MSEPTQDINPYSPPLAGRGSPEDEFVFSPRFRQAVLVWASVGCYCNIFLTPAIIIALASNVRILSRRPGLVVICLLLAIPAIHYLGFWLVSAVATSLLHHRLRDRFT